MRKLLAALALLALSGCAALPTSIDVQTGPELAVPGTQDFAYYSPAGPAVGATAQEIVSGFLAAGTGPQNDYAVAREFLSAGFAQRWQPVTKTLIRSGVPLFRESGQSVLLVEISLAATLDEHGRYQEAEQPETEVLRFQLVREGGEWRIDSAPNLTVVTQPVFSVVFNAFPVYFADSRKTILVPDLRWFPSRASTPTRLVNALLDGPSDWLAPSVTTAIPPETRLTINAVTVENGVALVDFNSNALAAGNLDRSIMLSQLRSTLIQISGINEVALSVNDSIQEISGQTLTNISSNGPTYVLNRSGIQRLSAGERTGLSGTDQLVRNYDPALFAITDDSRLIAFVSDTGVYLLRRDGISLQLEQVSELTEVVALDFDNYGSLWVFPSDAAEPIQIVDSRGTTRNLASNLTGTRISSVLSPEGNRLAQAIQDQSGQSAIAVQTITRDASLLPLRVVDGYQLNTVIGQPISITWNGANSLRVLELTVSGLSALNEYPLTGPRRALTMPPVVGKSILAGPSSISTYLLSEDGQLWVLTGNTWRSNSTGVIALAALR